MTRKDYVKFAEMFRGMFTNCINDIERITIIEACEQTSDIFSADNPNFDRERFLTACGVES